jgi:NTP pyrophosphatase (non-canonical NTP hydrolase)
MTPDTFETIVQRMRNDDKIFGDFTSTHEALGVAMEEWQEFLQAVRSNDQYEVQAEALDLVVVLLRLYEQLDSSETLRQRSGMFES